VQPDDEVNPSGRIFERSDMEASVKKKHLSSILFALLAIAVFSTGCLSFAKKEYRYVLKPDGTGEGTIRFIDIRSSDDDGRDVSFKDFAELVTDYVEGHKFEDDTPALHVIGKKLLEENGKLIGEVAFTFTSIDSAGFIARPKCACCPVLYFLKSDNNSESFAESNGKMISGVLSTPYIELDPGSKELRFTTTTEIDTNSARSLLAHFRTWKDRK
jgi:hypothetical protein